MVSIQYPMSIARVVRLARHPRSTAATLRGSTVSKDAPQIVPTGPAWSWQTSQVRGAGPQDAQICCGSLSGQAVPQACALISSIRGDHVQLAEPWEGFPAWREQHAGWPLCGMDGVSNSIRVPVGCRVGRPELSPAFMVRSGQVRSGQGILGAEVGVGPAKQVSDLVENPWGHGKKGQFRAKRCQLGRGRSSESRVNRR